ncbi:MAG: DUF1015 domain-containing protein [Bryobacteraceae bacterium]
MADIYPFRAYRYSPQAGPLKNLVTQPYDKITPQMQRRYLSLSPYNLVRIILGERFPQDSPSDNVYTRAARYLSDWIEQGVFVREPQPCLFAYFQEFTLPDTGERLLRNGFIGLGPVEDYSAGMVHRHEHTLTGPKQDRLELLRHTRTHFGQIFMLYPDPQGEVDRVLEEAASEEPIASVTDEYGAVHTLWRIAEPVWISAIQHAMWDKKLIIADGHHRYETALAFRNEHPELEDARKVMMTFVNLHSPGLRILATHRLVGEADAETFLKAAASEFRLAPLAGLASLLDAWKEPHPDVLRIGVAAAPDRLYLLEAPREAGTLDVSFLHARILKELLGIGEEDVKNEKRIRYVRGAEAAVQEVRQGQAALAFLLEPVSVYDVARIALAGGVMPQKSTDFYPKLLSGLTAYRLEK